jgi:hypothetical protein
MDHEGFAVGAAIVIAVLFVGLVWFLSVPGFLSEALASFFGTIAAFIFIVLVWWFCDAMWAQ